MRNNNAIWALGDAYELRVKTDQDDIDVSIFKNDLPVGNARLVTDQVDVSCITHIEVHNDHVNHVFPNGRKLGEVLLKFLIKFPSSVRKLEFRFILDVPLNLKEIALKFHFDQGKGTDIEDEIMIRPKGHFTFVATEPKELVISDRLSEEQSKEAFLLLKKNAYWRQNSSQEVFELILKNSFCFIATRENKIVAFARVCTNKNNFASLWDVAVDESCRKQGIASLLMEHIFKHPKLEKVTEWILFTDSAKPLYQKFGFFPSSNLKDRKIVHKLRLQDKEPDYIVDLQKIISLGLPACLNETQSHAFLFGNKRTLLFDFWKSLISHKEKIVNIVSSAPHH